MPDLTQFLVISALGKDRPGIVNALAKAILDHGCNIEDSRMTVLAGEFALMQLISGSWSAVAKLETAIPNLARKLDLTLVTRRAEGRAKKPDMLPYVVDVISMDHPGIVHDITAFFAGQGINIEEMSSWTYPAAHTGTPMFSLNLTISIPADVNISRLRQAFLDLCDELNIDATLEPSRQ